MKTWKQSTFFGFLAILAFAFTACPPDGNNDNGSTHTHDFGTVWKINATQHWHECSCGEKSDIANHTWDWEITAPATTETEGLKTEKCTVCGATSGNKQTIEKLPTYYTVTIDTLTNGLITANPTIGIEGTEITLTVNPDYLYQLKLGSLKFGTTVIDTTFKFNLPAENIIVTAEFESKLIGTWVFESGLISWTFSEDVIIVQDSNGKYTTKGYWTIENQNKLILTATHWDTNGVDIVDDLPEVTEIVIDYICELMSNTTLKTTRGSNVNTLTFLE